MSKQGKHRKRLVGLVAVASAATLLLAACGDSESSSSGGEAFYNSKTVELLVPYGPGGGTDTTARFLTPLLSKHVAGKPKIQVVNREGANTISGSNEFARAKKDGLNWFMSGSGVTVNYLLGLPDVHYSYEDFKPIIGVPLGAVTYVSPETGITKASEVRDSKVPLILSAQGVEGSSLMRVLALKVLDLDFKIVSGYDGGGAERVAFEQGEVNILGDTTPSYLEQVEPLVKEGKAVPLFTYGFPGPDGELIRDPAFPDLPTVAEVYEELNGEAPSGDIWEAYKVLLNANGTVQKVLWMDKKAPKAAIKALEDGVAATLKDPAYLDAVDDALGGYDLLIGKELEDVIDTVSNPDPAVLDWIKDFIKTLE